MQSSALLLTVVLSAIGRGAGHVKVQTEKIVRSECQQNVTLFCNISTPQKHFSILEFFWMNSSREKLCTHSGTLNPETSGHFYCQYTPMQQLALSIRSPGKNEEGQYFCKLFTNHGHDRVNTTLNVSGCPVGRAGDRSGRVESSKVGNQASTLQRKWTPLVLLLAALLLAFP